MRKLKFTPEDTEKLMRSIRNKFELDCKGDPYEFDFTKNEIKNFISENVQLERSRPVISVTSEIYCKMMALVTNCPTEISWHALVKHTGNYYIIYDLLMFPQYNTGTATTTDEDEFAAWQMELIKNKDFPYEDLRCHMHSHVNMSVFSSGVDDQYQKDIVSNLKEGDYYLFLVLNKRAEVCILLYDYKDNILYETDDVDFVVTDGNGTIIGKWAKEMIDTYCKEKEPEVPNYKNWPGYNISDEEYEEVYGYGSNYGYYGTKKKGGKKKHGSK